MSDLYPDPLSEDIAWVLSEAKELLGSRVTFNGVEYACTTESVSGANVGTQFLSHDALGAYLASADPRVFIFSPLLFTPITDVLPPIESDELIWHNLKYRVTRVTYDDVSTDTTDILVYAFREVL